MEMKVVVDKTEVEIRVANDDLRDLSELQLALIGGGIGETVL